MPVLVDGMDDAVSEAFAAWPERIYVVDANRRIAFAGGPGPWLRCRGSRAGPFDVLPLPQRG